MGEAGLVYGKPRGVAGRCRPGQARRALAVVLAAALLTAACSSGDSAGGDGGDGSGSGSEETDLEPQDGGEIVFGLTNLTEGGFCLPEAQFASSGIVAASAVYNGLIALNDKLEPTPYLAESFEPNETFDEWTIKVREGIEFHNGEVLDAELVKMNIDVYRGVESYPLIPTLSSFVFQEITGVEVVDDLTVKVTTSRPWPAFPVYWGAGRFMMMAAEQIQASRETCATTPIGTGPFKAVDTPWDLTGEIRVEKFDNYWRAEEGLPHLDAITFRAQPDEAKRVGNLTATSGGMDLIMVSDPIEIAELEEKAARGEVNILVAGDEQETVDYIMLNAERPPFDDPRAREALAVGLDRDLYNEVISGGRGTTADGPFGSAVMGHLEDSGFPDYDPERAQELIDEMGGLEFTLSFGAAPTNEQRADEVVTQMSAYDNVSIETHSVLQSEAINQAVSGDFDAFLWNNHPGSDPDTNYFWWYGGSPVNFGGFDDPEINRLLDEGHTADPADRPAIYEEINRRFADQLWNIWTSFAVTGWASKPEVHGFIDPPLLPNGDRPLQMVASIGQLVGVWIEQ
ncbi:MAG: hypothetical protein JJLCMIEE_03347 [Acidimicrobiales bacterium]|nr:hypothetical protein [Acidimicrobiales bacterium]